MDTGETLCDPERLLVPDQPLEAVQVSALPVTQERVADDPEVMLYEEEVRVRVGAGTTESGIGTVTALLPHPSTPNPLH